MKTVLLFAIVVVGALAYTDHVLRSDDTDAIPNQYIIVFHENVTQHDQDKHITLLQRTLKSRNDETNNKVLSTYRIGTFSGYSARLTSDVLSQEMNSEIVSYIEQDTIVRAIACSEQKQATWGLDRVGEQAINLDGKYHYNSLAGAGINAYVIDTGIQITHADFEKRATWGANFVDTTDTDCNGHGTHVAGTIAGKNWGVAKKANLIAVKVLGCDGSGTNTGVLNGINWAVADYQKKKTTSVANMSLGGGKSAAENAAVDAAVQAGMTMVVAAGNSDDDACAYSPASASLVISVGATGVDNLDGVDLDARAYFSNYGKCVDIFAPGLQIESAWIGKSNEDTKVISGTSMASPHVAGVAAVFLSTKPTATPADVSSFLLAEASNGIIELDCDGLAACNNSPNILVYSPC